MNQIVGTCPVCSDEMRVVRLRCRGCETALDGSFELASFQRLTPEQLYFIETFIRSRGKIKTVEEELGISYPTVVSRLDEVISALGYDMQEDAGSLTESRHKILDQLSDGSINVSDAITGLRAIQGA